ncbi:MAG: hypothetical protein CMM85_13340, partial [Rhodothermaceae bacterium]|nr:hypothetical protein [Rhodothermaceae bacterium]
MSPTALTALLLVALAACAPPASVPATTEADVDADAVADWSAAFEAEGAVGTMVLLDTQTGRTTRHDPDRAAERFSP